VLENVAGIAHSRSNANGEEVNTYTVMLCAIVGLGYQIESFLADAWSHGNCQSRTRLILAITKEDYEPLSRPPRSHPHAAGARQGALYEAPNGKRFGSREVEGLTPFRFCSVASCWDRLPHVGDGHVGMCIRYPDHISAAQPDSTTRLLMTHIPRFDHYKSWRSAIDSGRLHRALWTFPLVGEKKKATARTYSRVPRDGLCRTITTTPTPQCTRTGRWVHPDQNRLISVHEARIAQGYPDEDVLVGAPNKRLHVIGNSVARGVSLALGVSVREAYLKSDVDEFRVEVIADEDPMEVDDKTLLDVVVREKDGKASGLNGTAYKKAATVPRSPFASMFGSVVNGAANVVASAAAAVMGTASNASNGVLGDADHPMIID
jgi:DNA (cytosine-5)-methyltransferase 1